MTDLLDPDARIPLEQIAHDLGELAEQLATWGRIYRRRAYAADVRKEARRREGAGAAVAREAMLEHQRAEDRAELVEKFAQHAAELAEEADTMLAQSSMQSDTP